MEKKYLEIKPEDLDKVIASRKRHEKSKISKTWLFLGEFGKHYGWSGIMAIRNNEISMIEAEKLMIAARKIDMGKLYDSAAASFIGSASTNSKKPSKAFRDMTNKIIKESKADT